MRCATAAAKKLWRTRLADREAAGLRLLSSAVNYLQRNYWRPVGWESDAHAVAFGVLVSASLRLQAEKIGRSLRREIRK